MTRSRITETMHATVDAAADMAAWTPELQLFFFRQTLPDITPEETARLFPLFLQATTAEQPAEAWRENLARYQAAIAPIKRRQERGG